ncbi:butyrate kinase [Lachnospiraceae bacterium XBB1006]|nr:butyrate kinase [Lachnospiraceae bacterium XBB1006]
MKKILTINPGSTSTKIGVFEDEKEVFVKNIHHETEEVSKFPTIIEQKDFRQEVILKTLEEAGIELSGFDAIVGRGGLVKPIVSGTYATTDALLKDLREGVSGQHASNLGGILAHDIASKCGNIPSYIVDPVVVDEMEDVARISGHPKVPRCSIFHALNAKAIAKRYAKDCGKKYEDLNLIVAHLGGGVSVGAHKHGRVVDVYNALDGDGAFAPERSGGLPAGGLVRVLTSGEVDAKTASRMVTGEGGVVAYLGTNNMIEVEKRANSGDKEAKLVRDAFSYQICKDIGAMATVLEGKVDQILLTGGVANDKGMMEDIKKRVSFICPVSVYPGEDELLALAQGALRVLNGEEEAKIYE